MIVIIIVASSMHMAYMIQLMKEWSK